MSSTKTETRPPTSSSLNDGLATFVDAVETFASILANSPDSGVELAWLIRGVGEGLSILINDSTDEQIDETYGHEQMKGRRLIAEVDQ